MKTTKGNLPRITSLFGIIGLLIATSLILSFSTAAQSTQAQSANDHIPPASQSAAQKLRAFSQEFGPLAQPTTPQQGINVMIELDGAPTVLAFAAAKARGSAQAVPDAQAQLSRIEANQQRLLAPLAQLGANVLYRTQRVYNGIAVQTDLSKLAAIANLPGVKALHPIVLKHPDNASSVPLIGAPELWDNSGLNITGANIKIGIIDTGVDYIHTDFEGSGLASDYARNDTTTINESGLFPNARVVGGYDFVGDNYDPNSLNPANRTPKPDPDPMDCQGHGTHVAGTAAGNGVNGDGSAYTGPYGPSIDFNSLRIGPGVAPQAKIYALRVFGCSGSASSAIISQAIEYAVDPNKDGDLSDHLDVINMSLGSDFGSIYDVDAIASENATKAGVIVVASAGNAGDTFFVGGTPASAKSVMSVAASVDSTDYFDGFQVNTPPSIAGVKPAAFAANYNWANKPDTTGNLVYPPSQQNGCSTFNPSNVAIITGNIVLLDWDDTTGCGSAKRTGNAVIAGAKGVILVYNKPELDIAIAGSAVVPSVITTQAVGTQLKTTLASSLVNVTFSKTFANSQKVVNPARNDTLTSFTSRGAGRDGNLKPDITAPGQTIFSAKSGSGTEGVSESGTSMAAPHITGSMALLRQLHSDWTVQQLKALAMNTATKDLRVSNDSASQIFGPQRVGAGRVNLPNAAAQSVIAYNANDPDAVSVSFGAVEVTSTTTLTKSVTFLNKGTSSVTYTLAYSGVTTIPGVAYSVSQSSVTLAGGASADVTITLTANAAQMKHTRDNTLSSEQGTLPRHWLSEVAGYLTATPEGTTTVTHRVPIYATARPASVMKAQQSTIPPSATSAISLTGTGLTGTQVPTDEASVVTAFELQEKSAQIVPSSTISSSADLQYIGVASDYAFNAAKATDAVSNTMIYFGIATYGKWATPSEVSFYIYIDTNRDGKDDFVLVNSYVSSDTSGDPSDVFVSALYPININGSFGAGVLEDFINGIPASDRDTVPYNTNVMVLPVIAGDLKLSANNSAFNYHIETMQRDTFDATEQFVTVDKSATLSYDVTKPGIDPSGGIEGIPAYSDLPGKSIPISYNSANFANNKSQGALLLHHHNTSGNHAEVVTVSTSPPPSTLKFIRLPLISTGT